MQQFQPLRRYHHVQLGYARDVAAGPIQAGNQAGFDRITTDREYNWDAGGRGLGRECRGNRTRAEHGHIPANKISGHHWQSIIPAFRPAIFDSEILAVHIANVAQALAECAESGRRLSW